MISLSKIWLFQDKIRQLVRILAFSGGFRIFLTYLGPDFRHLLTGTFGIAIFSPHVTTLVRKWLFEALSGEKKWLFEANFEEFFGQALA